MKKRSALIYLVVLIYLGNTGLVYHLHTCLHSGQSAIVWHINEDTGGECATESHCGPDSNMSCCDKSNHDAQNNCTEKTTEYKNLDLQSVKPQFQYFSAPDVYWVITAINFNFNYLPDFYNALYFGNKIEHPPGLAPTSLQQRIALSSFLC